MKHLDRVGSPQWRVPVAAWAAWGADSGDNARMDLDYIEPMLRRRLSPLARAALHVAHLCARDRDSVQFVYASRHGELARTIEALYSLAREQALSPTTFSLSVLNSAAGVFSIARRDMAAATAVSAGTESFGFGLLEAFSRASLDPALPVLFVYGETLMPSPLPRQECDPETPIALGILIDPATATHELTMATQPAASGSSTCPQALACVNALRGKAGSWSCGVRSWHWELKEK